MWDDAKIGIRHLAAYEKVAVIADIEISFILLKIPFHRKASFMLEYGISRQVYLLAGKTGTINRVASGIHNNFPCLVSRVQGGGG